MLDRSFRRAAAGANAGFLLEKLGVARRPHHFVDGRGHMVAGEIQRVGPGHAPSVCASAIVGQISGGPLKELPRAKILTINGAPFVR